MVQTPCSTKSKSDKRCHLRGVDVFFPAEYSPKAALSDCSGLETLTDSYCFLLRCTSGLDSLLTRSWRSYWLSIKRHLFKIDQWLILSFNFFSLADLTRWLGGVIHVLEPADQLAKDSRKPASAFWKGPLLRGSPAPRLPGSPAPVKHCHICCTLKDWEEVTKLVWQADTGMESLWSLTDAQWSCVVLSKLVKFWMVKRYSDALHHASSSAMTCYE